MKKIKFKYADKKFSDMEPVSTYHVEYEPKLITRGTTSYAKITDRTKQK